MVIVFISLVGMVGGGAVSASGSTRRLERSPRVLQIWPARGAAVGGYRVHIIGRNFTKLSVVRFGRRRALRIRFRSSKLITAVAPSGRGLVHVRVHDRHGTSDRTRSNSFRFTKELAAPVPGSVVPEGSIPIPISSLAPITQQSVSQSITDPISPAAPGSSSSVTQPAAPVSTSSTSTQSTTSPLATSSSTSSGSASSSGSPQPPSSVPGPWTLKFDDEFNGSSLDSSKWTPYWFNDGATQNGTVMNSSNVSVSGGSLHLDLSQSSGGLVSSNGKYQFTYGYAEARIYLPAAGGQVANWPAFWTDGQNWPTDGEADVMEGLGGQACYHFHSPSGGPGGCPSGSYTGWHTFGVDWEPGSVTFYYDGAKVGSITSGITSAPMYLILENSLGSGPYSLPSTMLVDYVRVWQHS